MEKFIPCCLINGTPNFNYLNAEDESQINIFDNNNEKQQYLNIINKALLIYMGYF